MSKGHSTVLFVILGIVKTKSYMEALFSSQTLTVL